MPGSVRKFVRYPEFGGDVRPGAEIQQPSGCRETRDRRIYDGRVHDARPLLYRR